MTRMQIYKIKLDLFRQKVNKQKARLSRNTKNYDYEHKHLGKQKLDCELWLWNLTLTNLIHTSDFCMDDGGKDLALWLGTLNIKGGDWGWSAAVKTKAGDMDEPNDVQEWLGKTWQETKY